MNWYLMQLLPPRPDFASTMSDAEQATMGRHVSYWSEHVRSGVALIFSPVADPEGDWGVAIVRADSRDDVERLKQADPAVTEGVGRYNVFELPGAITAA